MDRRKRIAILVGQAEEEYQEQFISGFLEKVFAYDFDVCVFAMYQRFQESNDREIGDSSIFSLVDYDQFDALLLMLDTIQTPGVARKIEETVKKRFSGPVLCVDVESKNFPYIEMDYYEPSKKLVAHLIEHHGFTEIGYVTGWYGHKHAMQRLQAFKDCMEEHGLPVVEEWIYHGDFWYNGGEQMVERIIKQDGKLPQAIACANDYMAIGAAKMLEKYGYRVPGDVAIVGYDSVEAGINSPKPITSAPLSTREYGDYAGDCMLALFEGKELPAFKDNTKLFIGSSCGCQNDSVIPKVVLRERWDTDMSERAFYSANNHMNEDMLRQTNFYDLLRTIQSYTYQIQEFDEFHICLNEDWNDFEKKAQEGRQDEIYSLRMLHALRCYKDCTKDVHSFDTYFQKNLLLPVIHELQEKPRVYFFTPLYFEERSFGYAVVCYEKAKSYSSTHRMWLRNVMHGLECFRRIEAIQRSNEMLEASMTRDVLTGLYNYNGFLKQSDQLMRKIMRINANVGALAIDIKELMKINEVYGRAEGDRIIISVAHALKDIFPHGMSVCFGNGEMVTIVISNKDVGEILQRGYEQMVVQIAEESQASKIEYEVEMHYGMEVGRPRNNEGLERLVNVAISKKNGKKVSERKMIQGEELTDEEYKEAQIVKTLLDENRFNYHFQPIVNAKTGEIFGYEALMRPDVEPYLPPPVVLKYAEYFGRLYDVERSTFFNVLDIVKSNRHIFDGNTKIFINSIPGNFLREEDAQQLEEMVKDLKQMVVVELTEQLELSDDELSTLKEYYNKIEFMTALDDYGTGYSNVTNLLRYMPNCVKIDRMLLSNIQDSPQKQHFVKDIITFSHDNNILVLGEGVETQEELQMMIHLGADLIQGYYTARPSAEIVTSIAKNVKNEIIEFNRIENHNRGRRVYSSGKESRISLARLVAEKYSIIEISGEEDNEFRDVTISGVPDLDTDMYMRIKDGYRGRIVLENVTLQGGKHGASIDIGNDCDVVIALQGENRCLYGGIRVLPGSKLTMEGDGNLFINVDSANYFGIGNDMDAKHGEVVFEQDGIIEIKGSGMKGVAIGSGLGGIVRVQRGKYHIRLIGKDAVGIGCITGDVEPVVTECDMKIDISTERAVGVGSLCGRVNARLERLVYMGEFNADDAVGIGTIEGEGSDINLSHANIMINSRAYTLCGMGAFEGDVTIDLKDGSALITGDATKAIAWGNFRNDAIVSLRSAKMDGRVRT
uniref:EAL domain-containing protein n=1 Tax=Acetatifactor sp. TaxID=1872090 RepID=UPI00405689FA